MIDFIIEGIIGITEALQLAKAGYEIELTEQFDDLLQINTPCQLGPGFHLRDLELAKAYMPLSIEVIKKYPQFIIDNEKNSYQGTRYVHCLDQSVVCLGHKMSTAEFQIALHQEYRKSVAINPLNKVFREVSPIGPGWFLKTLAISTYKSQIKTSHIFGVLEFVEKTLDWPKLKAYLIKEITEQKNITFNKKPMPLSSSNLSAGILMTADSKSNSFEVTVEVQLPADFSKKDANDEKSASVDPVNCMYFYWVPHDFYFMNMGNSTAFITYKISTNTVKLTGTAAQEITFDVPEFCKKGLAINASETEKAKYGQAMIDNISKLVPKLAKAEYKAIHFAPVLLKSRNEKVYRVLSDPRSLRSVDIIPKPEAKTAPAPKKKINKHTNVSVKIETLSNPMTRFFTSQPQPQASSKVTAKHSIKQKSTIPQLVQKPMRFGK